MLRRSNFKQWNFSPKWQDGESLRLKVAGLRRRIRGDTDSIQTGVRGKSEEIQRKSDRGGLQENKEKWYIHIQLSVQVRNNKCSGWKGETKQFAHRIFLRSVKVLKSHRSGSGNGDLLTSLECKLLLSFSFSHFHPMSGGAPGKVQMRATGE